MKRRPELVALSDDHHRALVLARRARTAAASCEASALIEAWQAVRKEFHGDLAPHFVVEEKYLLPPLRSGEGLPLVRRVEEDHGALRAMATGDASDALTLATFAERLNAHVRFEERVLFPYAEKRLSPDELRRIAEAVRED